MLSGSYHNTLDCNVSGNSPWVGSLYLAALKACSKMADVVGEPKSGEYYESLFKKGKGIQNKELWDEELGCYVEKTQNIPNTLNMNQGISIDMFLGQWWANQLGLGEIYPTDRICRGLFAIYKQNKFTDTTGHYEAHFRDFLGKGDTGWVMCAYPKGVPEKRVHYYDEIMSGFEYSFATTLIQYGFQKEGLSVIHEIYKRYDGRLRAENEVHMANNSTVYGTGSPVGEDECGDFYGRAMSSWSSLLALQGFQYDGPSHSISFKPRWQPHDHQSFFSTSQAWGLFTQKQEKESQTICLEVHYGELSLSKFHFEVPENNIVNNVFISGKGHSGVKLLFKQDGNCLSIELESILVLRKESLKNKSELLTIAIKYLP